jgi:L-asparaginase
MQINSGLVVVVGTGGTIAGTAPQAAGAAAGHSSYTAGTLSIGHLVDVVPALQGQALELEQLANVDSCDMDHSLWQALHQSLSRHLQRPEVVGVVVTHGTDTLEETAYFLHRTLSANKPVVLTAAMRPATALSADGPQNLLDAVKVAQHPGARGVLAVMQQKVHAGADLRKLHGYRLDAFDSGDAGLVAVCEDGQLRVFRPWPAQAIHPLAASLPPTHSWPEVDIVTSHAGANGKLLTAAVRAGAKGIVIAGTGNGTVHRELLQAAQLAKAQGVSVIRSSRCLAGGVVCTLLAEAKAPTTGEQHLTIDTLADTQLTPQQARIELMLDLMYGFGVMQQTRLN